MRIERDVAAPERISSQISSSRIIGGERSKKLAPYMAGLFWKFGKGKNDFVMFCSGVLVSKYWVMTAAHCERNYGFRFDYAILGNEKASRGTAIRVERIVKPRQDGPRHFRFNRDIAFVKLSEPAPEGSKFALVNGDHFAVPDGMEMTVAGYGVSMHPNGRALPPIDEILREAEVPAVSQSACIEAYGKLKKPVKITRQMMCAGTPGSGPCEADSGGPLLRYTAEGRPVVVGIVSASLACARKTPAIYTRTSTFLRFMREKKVEFEKGPASLF